MKRKESTPMDKLCVNGKTFKIIKLLGKGKGGYSYLAHDGENEFVLKQIHHEPCDYYKFGDKIGAEVADYKKLLDVGILMPKMIDVDYENERILKQYINGATIFELIVAEKMQSIYLEQVESMCEKLYHKNINIDYFPTNFVVQDELLYYIDYECNDYMEEWNFQNWGIKYWSKTKEFTEYIENSPHS